MSIRYDFVCFFLFITFSHCISWINTLSFRNQQECSIAHCQMCNWLRSVHLIFFHFNSFSLHLLAEKSIRFDFNFVYFHKSAHNFMTTTIAIIAFRYFLLFNVDNRFRNEIKTQREIILIHDLFIFGWMWHMGYHVCFDVLFFSFISSLVNVCICFWCRIVKHNSFWSAHRTQTTGLTTVLFCNWFHSSTKFNVHFILWHSSMNDFLLLFFSIIWFDKIATKTCLCFFFRVYGREKMRLESMTHEYSTEKSLHRMDERKIAGKSNCTD